MLSKTLYHSVPLQHFTPGCAFRNFCLFRALAAALVFVRGYTDDSWNREFQGWGGESP